MRQVDARLEVAKEAEGQTERRGSQATSNVSEGGKERGEAKKLKFSMASSPNKTTYPASTLAQHYGNDGRNTLTEMAAKEQKQSSLDAGKIQLNTKSDLRN